MASVVELSYFCVTYKARYVSESYKLAYKNGELDLGRGDLLSTGKELIKVGSGVIINPKGIIVSNAHVTRAYPCCKSNDYNTVTICVPALLDMFLKEASKNLDGEGLEWEKLSKLYPSLFDLRVMYVSTAKLVDIEKNDMKTSLKYAALITIDDEKDKVDDQTTKKSRDDNDIYPKDRAILQLFANIDETVAQKDFDGAKELDDENFHMNDLNLPYAKLGNPFDVSFTDNEVCSLGFPGVGDEERVAKTSGNFLGYLNKRQSCILHTTFISYGNSGGGLFYNDRLIGVNTWFSYKDSYHPVSVSQPITFWNEYFAFDADTNNLILDSWIKSDPSTADYKDECVLVLTTNETDKEKLRNYQYIIYKEPKDFSGERYFNKIDDIKNLEKACAELQSSKNRWLSRRSNRYYGGYYDDYGYYHDYNNNDYYNSADSWEPDYDEISKNCATDKETLAILKKRVTDGGEELVDCLTDTLLPIYKAYKKNTFSFDKIIAYPAGYVMTMYFARNIGDQVYSVKKGQDYGVAIQDIKEEKNPFAFKSIHVGNESKKIVKLEVISSEGVNE